MAEAQTKDSVVGLVIQYIHKGNKTKGSAISIISCKAVQKYLQQFVQLVIKQGMLHLVYITNDVESHQLVLLKEYQQAMLHILYDDYGHQGMDCTLAAVRERFYWHTMYQDVTKYVTNCYWYHVTKGHCTGPHTQQGHLLPIIPWTCCVLTS